MSEDKHPLMGNPKWVFNQPQVGIRARYLAVESEVDNPKKTVLTVEAGSTCREGVISSIREVFQARLTNVKEVNASEGQGWKSQRPKWTTTKEVDLQDPASKQERSYLKIQWHSAWMQDWEPSVEEFIKVCNVVIGPITVLLGPWRPEGEDWWKTDPKEALRKKGDHEFVYWNGTDNWFLAHPATVGIATGLYRQCFHLCIAGFAGEVIKTLSEEEVSEVMSSNSLKLAMRAIKKTRPWIEVPVGANGGKINYAFPFGLWRRLTRLQRAVRRYGYEESLGQTFHEGWATTVGMDYSGLYAFWGTEGELTDHHRHLMKMGVPRRKKSDKPAKSPA